MKRSNGRYLGKKRTNECGLTVKSVFLKYLPFAGLLIDEFTDRKSGHDPQKAVAYFSLILKSSLKNTLESAAKDIPIG